MMRWLAFLAALCVTTPVLAGSAQARLDRSKVSLEDEVTLTISVVGDADKPELPNSLAVDFEVQSSGQANQVQIINGSMSSSTRYTYTLLPRHSGTLIVPAIPVTVDGTRLATEPLELLVTAGAASGHAGDGIAMSAELVPASGERESAFVGEQLIYTLRILARVNASCPGLKLPDIPNAANYPMGEQRQYRTRVDGDEVSVVEERRAVFADKPGVLEIPAVRLTCTVEGRSRRNDFDSFFQQLGGARKVLRSNAARIAVQALPKPPADFSGLVGDVALTTDLSKHEAHVGDSVTLSMRLHGTADVTAAHEPHVVLGDSVKIYDDKPMVRYETAGAALLSERTFQKALVAQRAGELTIASPKITYFDPLRRTYRSAESAPLTLRVLPGSEPVVDDSREPPLATAAATALAASPPPGARLDPETIVLRDLDGGLATWLHGWRLAVLVAVPLLIAWRMRARRGSRRDILSAEHRRAAERALVELRSVGSDAREISRVVRQLIGAYVGHHGAALSTVEALDALVKHGIDAGLIGRAHAVLTACDAAVYGGATQDVYLRDDAVALAKGLAEGRS